MPAKCNFLSVRTPAQSGHVANVALTGQTANIPTTTLFTPRSGEFLLYLEY